MVVWSTRPKLRHRMGIAGWGTKENEPATQMIRTIRVWEATMMAREAIGHYARHFLATVSRR